MKFFTEPNGKFVIKIPTEWQYRNIIEGYAEASPFCFESYTESPGSFQISCYSTIEKPITSKIKVQKYNSNNLEFIPRRMDGGGFNMHLWYAIVEDHSIMAKYIYETKNEKNPQIQVEIKKALKALTSFELINPEARDLALELDRYEKFNASLAASFDLKNRAIQNDAFIELLIIIANQIDAYLRIAIVMKRQLLEKTNRVDIGLLYQGENDKAIPERKIYRQANDMGIIDQNIYDQLESLYAKRNKVVHRFIISEFKTRYILDIVYEYELICEEVRLRLSQVEHEQFSKQIGIHGNARNPDDEPTKENINMLYSQVNDKHLTTDFYREIKIDDADQWINNIVDADDKG